MYAFVNHKLPKSFDGVFRLNSDVQVSHITRQSNLINVPRCHSAYSGRLPIYSFPVIWNEWIHRVPYCTPKSQFKNRLKAHIISNYLDKVKCTYRSCKHCHT